MLHSQNLNSVFFHLLVRFACAKRLLLLLISCFHWWFWTRNCTYSFLSIKYIFLSGQASEINLSSVFNLFCKVHCSTILFQQTMTFNLGGDREKHAFLSHWNYLLAKKMFGVWGKGSSYFCTFLINQFLADTVHQQKFGDN